MSSPEIRIRTWIRGSADDERQGLLGFLSLNYGLLVLDGVTVRRTAGGRFALSWPVKTDRAGRRHSYMRPADDDARRELERAILGALAEQTEVEL